MKEIERGSIKHLCLLIVTISLFGMVLYPFFDIIYYNVIIKDQFSYSFNSYVIQPIIFGFILGVVLWIVDKKKNK